MHEPLAPVRIFRASYGPRIAGALMTVICMLGTLLPLWTKPFDPIPYGIRMGVAGAMLAICVRLFVKQARHRLEVGPAGLSILRGLRPVTFTWDAFDSFGAPRPGELILRTRDRQLVTLTGWREFEAMVPLVTRHLEKALTDRPAVAPTQH